MLTPILSVLNNKEHMLETLEGKWNYFYVRFNKRTKTSNRGLMGLVIQNPK